MWSTSHESPGTMEGEPPEPMAHAKEKCEQNKDQLESLKEIMLRNKQSLKKKEEEVQEYARRLSKIKSRAKLSRRSKEGSAPCKDATQSAKSDAVVPEASNEVTDDTSQVKSSKAKSTLLQKKLAENRKAFEQRSKEMTETKRAVEEKVEAIRQQLDEQHSTITALQKDQLSVTPIRPVVVTSDVMSPIQIDNIQEKERKIIELNNKILELEATVLDLQENLKEKDSVIESKTRAVTLMSADLSRKGKTTLDTLEDTKDEMRTMQEHFVLLETSLRNKNDSLLEQLEQRNEKITELEESLVRFEKQMNEQKLSESAGADFSRSTMDTLLETKDAMKSMQENFILIESSLKANNKNLLQQLNEYELKLAEANERIFTLESGIGIVKDPSIDDLQFKLQNLERSNKQLQDEKYELQKSIAEMQDKIVNRSVHGNGALMEKDNRIAELESLVEELKQSNNLLEEESKTELQKQITHLTLKNDEYSNKITDLEKMVHDLEAEKNDIATKLPHEKTSAREDEKVEKLTKELEDLNKTMIKIKAQHRSKTKNLQKQLANFKKVSDTNAELIRLGNQVAILEEEKGNLQLSLVDFDELKASAGDWQERIADLETKVSAQTKEIQMNIEAIAILENQKLDLMQELHTAKQEVAALEAENAESENLRVTAEMKVVDLEEQLESIQKSQSVNKSESSSEMNQSVEGELVKRIEALSQENSELYNKIGKLEEKGASDSGSTESFEAIQASDKSDRLKKVEDLTQKSSDMKLKSEEKADSHAGSTESFETINDTDKSELLKKIDQLTQENTDLTVKLSRIEDKGSSDTGSTESFERIPEHSEGMTKIELLTQENNELVIKLTKLEEQLGYTGAGPVEPSRSDDDTKLQIATLLEENNNKSMELTKLKLQVTEFIEENNSLQKRIEILSSENNDLVIMHAKLEEHINQLKAGSNVADRSKREVDATGEVDVLQQEKQRLEKEVKELRNALEQSNNASSEEIVVNELKSRIEELLQENARVQAKIAEVEEFNQKLKDNLTEVTQEKEELLLKINQTMSEDVARERLELIDKLEKLNQEKESVAQERKDLHEEITTLLHKSNEELPEAQKLVDPETQETELVVVASLEREIEESKKLIAEQIGIIEELKMKLASKEEELEQKSSLIAEYEASGKKAESLDNELKEMLNTVEEWKYKCNEMQEKMQILEAGKASIEEGFKMLQDEHEVLLEEKSEKDASSTLVQQQLESTITSLESRLQELIDAASAKDNEIVSLRDHIQNKDRELSAKYTQLQNEMVVVDSLKDELTSLRHVMQGKDALLSSMSDEIANLNNVMRNKEEEIYSLRKDNSELNEKLVNSKPSEEYHRLVQQLTNKDMVLTDVQNGLNAATRVNDDLLEKVNNLSQRNDEIQNQLIAKQQEFADLSAVKEQLDAEIIEVTTDKSEAEKRIWELQDMLDDHSKYVEELQAELKNAYKQIELLKVKHTEDTEMQTHRLENIIVELNNKSQECDALRSELQEKERLVGQNMTEETKAALEARVAELEQKLTESEEKVQAQLEKMKKIAANLKKKTAMCQELDARVAELEEKWTTEKDEKEAKNKQIQEVEILMREKDNKIVDLEEKLTQARNETAEAMKTIDSLMKDLESSKEKISVLTQQITQMEEEIVRLQENLEATTTTLAEEKQAKEKISAEFDSYKQETIETNEKKQLELDEVKEQARELSVRMQVMETEYLEQLAQITNLKTENGLLLSKQTQINEKLEDAEKESEERRVLIEKLQKEIVRRTEMSTETVTTQTSEESTIQDDSRSASGQTLAQASEAKSQEREDNELANSADNFGQVRESSRFNDTTNQTDTDFSNWKEYNTLVSSFEAMKLQFSDATEENRKQAEIIEGLQSANATLKEKIAAGGQTLEEGTRTTEKPQSAESSGAAPLNKYDERESELLSLQKELQVVQDRASYLEQQLNSQSALLESEKQQLTEKETLLMDTQHSLEKEIEFLKADRDSCQKKIKDLETELKMYNQGSIESGTESTIVKREVSALDVAQDDRDNVPPLFDASKIFGVSFTSDTDISSNKEVTRLQNLLDEKEVQYNNLTQEIDHLQRQMIEERSKMLQNYDQCTNELKISQEQLQAARTMQERLEQMVIEKNIQIDTLSNELNNISLPSTMQHDEQNEIERLKELLLAKNYQIEDLEIVLNNTKAELGGVRTLREVENRTLEAYKAQIANLEEELKNPADSELIQELEHRISSTLKEKDLLQLQVNDLTRSMEELKDSLEVGRNLQAEIEKSRQERDEAKELAASLKQLLEDSHRSPAGQTNTAVDLPVTESSSSEESAVPPKRADDKTLKAVDQAAEQVAHLEIGSTWDMGSSEKLNIDEETWGWNADDVQLAAGDQHLTTTVASAELQLRVKVDDLQDRVRDLEAEKEKLIEENKAAQVRSGKMIKKLKEYKVLMESLQQQLKIQKSASDFYELDSAIEQELKAQIDKLEKSLSEIREEHRNTVAEKEALAKRLDVVVSANERYMEMKERQDMDMEVLRIRNKELTNKIQALDERLQGNETNLEKTDSSWTEDQGVVSTVEAKPRNDRTKERSVDEEDFEALCKKYREEIDDLKGEMEALATENEHLQHFLEEQKTKLSTLESKRIADEDESIQIVENLNKRIFELQGMLNKSKEEYDLLRKQYEQSLMDANDQVSIMRQNTDFIKGEALEKTSKLEMEISDLRQQVEVSDLKVTELQRNLQDVMQEKENLEKELATLAESSEKQLFTVNSSMAEVTDLLNARIQEVADFRQELQKQYIDHEEEKAKLHNAMQELMQELSEKKQELESLRLSFSNKESEVIQQQSVEVVSALVSQATQELVQKHAIEIEGKDKEIRNLKETASTLQLAMDEYLLEMQSNASKVNAQQEEFEFLKQNLTEKDTLLNSVQAELLSVRQELITKQSQISAYEEELEWFKSENQKYSAEIENLRKQLNELTVSPTDGQESIQRIQNLESEVERLRSALEEKLTIIGQYDQESKQYKTDLESYQTEIHALRAGLQETDALKTKLQEKTEHLNNISLELEATSKALEETKSILSEKVSLLEASDQMLIAKQMEIDKLSVVPEQHYKPSSIVDGLPLFRMSDDKENLQTTIDSLQEMLQKKQEEIENLKYILDENTYPSIIREMQERINCLYDEKAELESALQTTKQSLTKNEQQLDDLRQQVQTQSQEFVSKEETASLTRERRSTHDQEEIVRLQNELHVKEQEINELKYIIAEKDSQLSLQASMEPQSDDFELREMVQRLTTELYGKEQEIQHLRSTIAELQKEVSRLQEFEKLCDVKEEAIQKLSAEKEEVRLEAQEFLERKLREKEMEIDELKQRVAIENRNIIDELHLRDKDIENLKKHLEESSMVAERTNDKLRRTEQEFHQVNTDLAEKERRLAELSITKDAELHNLKVQIHEKEVRIDELLALSAEEEKQLVELRNSLEARETEINALKKLLENKVKEYELIENALKKDVPIMGASTTESMEGASTEDKESTSQELDLALYMLHQRDVRCEELTHELMQLLEERDTLQLRLSNAIRVNEELRRVGSSEFSPKEASSASGSEEPAVEHPSPSKSDGPVEIAKEAIDASIGEDKEALAVKLSQLHTVSHAKDVRLRDERELRHTQQMSLLAHKDVLSTLPPEAAARLINANYTLSRDVQSQSSVLLNWLWGKSTPKVVHM